MSVLKAENLVDDETLNAIHLQFEHILRHKELKPHAPREIDASYVFHELISQGRIAQRPLAMRQGTSRDGVDFVNRIAPRRRLRGMAPLLLAAFCSWPLGRAQAAFAPLEI